MVVQVNGCILILYNSDSIVERTRKLMDSAQGDLGPKPKIEMHFLPKIAACRPCVDIEIPKELEELKFRTGPLAPK